MPESTPTKKPEMGKWGCWRFFAAEPSIRPYLPPTSILHVNSLRNFLTTHNAVYIKPSAGWGGRGIIKAWKTPTGFAFVQEVGQPIHCATVENLLQKVRQGARPGGTYLVQKAIPLAQVNGRPYDIRLMLMRVKGQWQYVGMLAKVAGPNSVVTNIARGKGYVLDVDTALRRSLGLSHVQIEALKQEMIELGMRTVKRFDAYKRYYQIGLDLAVDQNGKLWMIEENTGPAHSLFAKLPDKTMYNRIKQVVAMWRKNRAAKSSST